MVNIFLIRHAESQPSDSLPESDWPLSPKGLTQAQTLRDQLIKVQIDAIYSSPYKRALDTISPLAKSLNIEVQTVDDLRERKLSEGLIDNWLEELKKTWDNFDYSLPNGETSKNCQARMVKCIEHICLAHTNNSVVISSHGNAIALTLNQIDSSFAFNEWGKMRTPDVFKLVYSNKLDWIKEFSV